MYYGLTTCEEIIINALTRQHWQKVDSSCQHRQRVDRYCLKAFYINFCWYLFHLFSGGSFLFDDVLIMTLQGRTVNWSCSSLPPLVLSISSATQVKEFSLF